MQRVLGFDWLMLFLQGNLHPSTVILTLRTLATILTNSNCRQKFREGVNGGGWLRGTECVLQNRYGTFVGFRLTPTSKDRKREINQEMCHIPGFQALSFLLQRHTDIPEIYFILMAMLLDQPIHNLPHKIKVRAIPLEWAGGPPSCYLPVPQS